MSVVDNDRAEESANPLARRTPLAIRAEESRDTSDVDVNHMAANWRLWNDKPEPQDPWGNDDAA